MQFTSKVFMEKLQSDKVLINIDDKGYYDNIFIERLWRLLKYEEVYLKLYDLMGKAKILIRNYLSFYNHISRIRL